MGSSLSDAKKQNLAFLAAAFVILILNFWKAFQGMGSADEHFYATLGLRFANGDRLFLDDWHIAQMISFFLEPLVRLHLSAIGSTDFIILFTRMVYSLFSCLCGGGLYLRFRSHGMASAVAAAVWMLFTPFQIMALSYNTMSAGFVLLSACAYSEDSNSWVRLILCGLFAGFAVINTPYLVLFYGFLTIVTIVRPSAFSHRHWLGITIGALISAILFLVWLNGHTPLGEIPGAIGHLIDPSHSGGIRQVIRNLALLWRHYSIAAPLLVLCVLLSAVFKDKPEPLKTRYCTCVKVLAMLAMIYAGALNGYQKNLGGHGTLLFAFAAYGLSDIILEKRKGYACTVFFISLFHSAMILFSSNVGPRSFTAPLILACAMTVLLQKDQLFTRSAVPLCTIVLAVLLVYGKAVDVYDGNGSYHTRIKEGPLAGLLDSEEAVFQYRKSLADIQELNTMPSANTMLVTWNVWEYLSLNKQISTFSTYPYFWEREEYVRADELYRNEHPDRAFGYIYLDHADPPYDLKDSDPMFLDLRKVRDMRSGTLFEREERR